MHKQDRSELSLELMPEYMVAEHLTRTLCFQSLKEPFDFRNDSRREPA